MSRLPPRLLPDRVTWRRMTITRNEFGEPETTTENIEVAASVQSLMLSDDEFAGGISAEDKRAVYMRDTPAITDAIVIGGEVFNVTDIQSWPDHARVRVVRAT